MDAHRPYVPPAGHDRLFGRVSEPVLWHISGTLHDGHWGHPVSPSEREEMIDGYDNSLHYLDSQISQLLDKLRASPNGARTFVIVAGDHGEGFGDHGTYDHGWDLYREVLHVPLIVSGPGIPAGKRVATVAELRQLFPTVIELALGKVGAPVLPASLSHTWMLGSIPDLVAPPAVSELVPSAADGRARSVLSLTDAHWHFLLYSDGQTKLFEWQKDELELHNLATSISMQPVIEQLRAQLEAVLAHSVSPWWQVDYLAPLDLPGQPFVKRALTNPQAFPSVGPPVGDSQSFFLEHQPVPPTRPNPAQEELLRSLPYH
jgi:arylsulfatase A-like enzyme